MYCAHCYVRDRVRHCVRRYAFVIAYDTRVRDRVRHCVTRYAKHDIQRDVLILMSSSESPFAPALMAEA